MFSQFFGQFLLNRGYLTSAELLDVLNRTSQAHVRLGVMAMGHKLLTADQVEEIHAIQAREDKRFGQIALDLGYLTGDQLDELLAGQKNEHMQMVQVLLDSKLFSLDDLDRLLEEYRDSNAMDEVALQALMDGQVDTYVDLFLNLQDAFDPVSCREYVCLFLKNFIRFIDRGICFEPIQCPENYHNTYLATQVLEGKNRMLTGIGGSGEALLELASRFSQEPISEIEDLMADAVGEFLNLQNGIFTVNMSDQGVEMEMEPQIFLTNPNIPGKMGLWVLPISSSWGRIDLVLAQLVD